MGVDEENDKKTANSRCKRQAGGNSAPPTLRTSSPQSLGESSQCQPGGQAKIGSIIIIATTSTNSTFAATNVAIAITITISSSIAVICMLLQLL